MLEVEFFGVRGALPSPLSPGDYSARIHELLRLLSPEDLANDQSREACVARIAAEAKHVGGNSSCVRIHGESSSVLICEAGTGIRVLGEALLKERNVSKEICIFISNPHIDHLQGLPYFAPLHHEDFSVRVLGCHSDFEERCRAVLDASSHPGSRRSIRAQLSFETLREGKEIRLGQIRVTPFMLDHPGDSYAYSITDMAKKIIYSADSSYSVLSRDDSEERKLIAGAELWVYDGMHRFEDYVDRLDSGHSSSLVGVDYAIRDGVKHLVISHHDYEYTDSQLGALAEETQNYAKGQSGCSDLQVTIAKEGDRIRV